LLIQYIKTNISVIVNVYQPEYFNSKKATGFGDFIRGTYFVMQFCNLVGANIDICINHPFKKFLKLQKNRICNLQQDDIYAFDKNNFHPEDQEDPDYKTEIIYEFCNYLKEQVFENKVATIYSISFPFDPISDKMRQTIIKSLEPTNEFKDDIMNELNTLKLEFKKYAVIHIRSGDDVLINNDDINSNYLQKILGEINTVYRPGYKFLLISDSVKLKQRILEIFPTIIASFNEITHSGEGQNLEDEKVKNTLLDFYLMAYSVRIFSYSCYDHGTGFSRWCAETFKVPYSCKIVK
jgi:hypothetical protein